MSSIFLLARRYLAYHRTRTALLACAIALVLFLPLCVELLVRGFGAALAARAEATPLVVGAPGSRYDLVLNALYFRGRVPEPTSRAELERLLESDLGLPVPLIVRRTAGGWPVVGTSYDYFAFRGLELAEGDFPALLGEAALGARAAADLGLSAGDTLLSDRGSLYDLTSSYPLRMRVVGVLAETGTPDDGAVFCDLGTAWILEGIGHGHAEPEEAGEDSVLRREGGEVVYNAALVEATEITPDNVDSFHFHGSSEDFPLTGILVRPRDAKSRTILKGRYGVREDAQMLVPTEVMDELLGFVLKLKVFFDANVVLVLTATALLLALVVLLDLRVRRRELETLFRIGCARATVYRLVGTELGLVVATGAVLAGLGAGAAFLLVGRSSGILF